MKKRSWTVNFNKFVAQGMIFSVCPFMAYRQMSSLVYIYCTSIKVSLPLYTPATPFPLQATLYIQKGRESNHHAAAAGFRP